LSEDRHRRLADVDVSPYVDPVRTLIAKLVLLVAVLLMPFAMAPAAASASRQEAAIGSAIGHCVDQHQRDQSNRGIAECTMACAAALPATGAVVMTPIVVVEVLSPPVTKHRLHGLHPDIATPPPRATV
jgi:uncharacterized membrane protein